MEGRSRDISKDTCWFVPASELDNPQGAKLQRAFSPLSTTDQMVEEFSPFSITLETFCVNGQHDNGRTTNDLLVRSRVRYGDAPTTDTINFFELGVPTGTVRSNLEFEYIFGQEYHLSQNRVWLEVSITEVDKGIRTNDHAFLGVLKDLKAEFGAVFPVLVPFAGPGFNLVSGLVKLATSQQEDVLVFKSEVDLYSVSSEGEAKLRYGAYVLFNQPVEAVQYQLRGLQLEYLSLAKKVSQYVMTM